MKYCLPQYVHTVTKVYAVCNLDIIYLPSCYIHEIHQLRSSLEYIRAHNYLWPIPSRTIPCMVLYVNFILDGLNIHIFRTGLPLLWYHIKFSSVGKVCIFIINIIYPSTAFGQTTITLNFTPDLH